jgi:hypothetical protein
MQFQGVAIELPMLNDLVDHEATFLALESSNVGFGGSRSVEANHSRDMQRTHDRSINVVRCCQ